MNAGVMKPGQLIKEIHQWRHFNETKIEKYEIHCSRANNLGHYTQFAGGRINAAPAFINRRNRNVR
jgi:hypothetical protein